MTTAFLYARFSPRPDDEEKDSSIERQDSAEKQIERCTDYATRKGYKIFRYDYEDKNISGGTLHRPALQAAIDDISFHVKQAKECILIVDTPDRLARDVLVYLTIRQQVADAGGRIEYADGSPLDSTPEGELLLNILAAFAQYERSRIRHRTKRGLKKRQEEGEWFGKPPVGYQRDPENSKKLIPHITERKAVSRAKTSKKFGWNSRKTTEDLQKVLGNFRGKPWSQRTVRKMIKKIHDWEEDSDKSDEES